MAVKSLIKPHEQNLLGKNLKLSFQNPNRWTKETKLDEQYGKNMRMKQHELQESKYEFKRKLAKEDDKIPKFENLNQILLKKLRNSKKEI